MREILSETLTKEKIIIPVYYIIDDEVSVVLLKWYIKTEREAIDYFVNISIGVCAFLMNYLYLESRYTFKS